MERVGYMYVGSPVMDYFRQLFGLRKSLGGGGETALMNKDIEGEKEDLTASFVQMLQSFIS